MSQAVRRTDIPGLPVRRGKVRDIYELDAKRLLFVATDRISAFDVILDEPIPDKGKVLTRLSVFWFEYLGDEVISHMEKYLDSPEAVADFDERLADHAEKIGRASCRERV